MFIGASVLVAAGKLDPLAVLLFGALGAATGDQIGALRAARTDRRVAFAFSYRCGAPYLDRRAGAAPPIVDDPGDSLRTGLRIAITAACAYGSISPIRFDDGLNLIGAFMWAAALLTPVSA